MIRKHYRVLSYFFIATILSVLLINSFFQPKPTYAAACDSGGVARCFRGQDVFIPRSYGSQMSMYTANIFQGNTTFLWLQSYVIIGGVQHFIQVDTSYGANTYCSQMYGPFALAVYSEIYIGGDPQNIFNYAPHCAGTIGAGTNNYYLQTNSSGSNGMWCAGFNGNSCFNSISNGGIGFSTQVDSVAYGETSDSTYTMGGPNYATRAQMNQIIYKSTANGGFDHAMPNAGNSYPQTVNPNGGCGVPNCPYSEIADFEGVPSNLSVQIWTN